MATGADVRDHVQNDQLAAITWLADCLPRLTRRQRVVVSAVYQGMTTGEIAQQIQCTPRTVRRVVERIRRQCPL